MDYNYEILEKDILKRIPERLKYSNKGTYGHVLIIAGSKGMSGAAYLSALSAYRTGAGLVKILTVEENRFILQTGLPEAIIDCFEEEDILYNDEGFTDTLKADLAWASVIVLGPGLSTKEYVPNLVERVLTEAFVPIIIDADAINIIAKYPYLTKYYTDNIILTPHLKEMSRLTGLSVEQIKESPVETVLEYQREHGISCILKSHNSIIITKDEKIYMNKLSAAALSKAGTGDVLTGIIAGIICLGIDYGEAAAIAVYIHALAGVEAAKKLGEHGVIARDIAAYIPYIMKTKDNF